MNLHDRHVHAVNIVTNMSLRPPAIVLSLS